MACTEAYKEHIKKDTEYGIKQRLVSALAEKTGNVVAYHFHGQAGRPDNGNCLESGEISV